MYPFVSNSNPVLNLRELIGKADILFITLDTLRYDVAQAAHANDLTPQTSRWLGPGGWEQRHSPGNFTFASHQAFFAGFLPTPLSPGPHPRLFAARFLGSETTTDETWVFEQDNVVEALTCIGYRTICIGGVGFFNRKTTLGSVLPNRFQESYWHESFGVTCPQSTENQVRLAVELLEKTPVQNRCFLFINVSAIHQPNCFYHPSATSDSLQTHRAALVYVDSWLGYLFDHCSRRATTFCIVCSDHGTAYGEDGYYGHRLNHQVVGDVPYKHFVIPHSSQPS